jgi:hypothetical protein
MVLKEKEYKQSSIDINIGLADLIIWGKIYSKVITKIFSRNILAIQTDITTPNQEFRGYTSKEIYMLRSYVFLKDITNDGKTDLITDYNPPPDYYDGGAVRRGGYPVDTTVRYMLHTNNRAISTEIAEEIDANGDGINDLLIKMFGLGTHHTYLWLGSRTFSQLPVRNWLAQEYWKEDYRGI